MNSLKKGTSYVGNNLFFQDSKTRVIAINYFNEELNQALKVSIQDFDPNDGTKLVSRLDAIRMNFDTLKKKWVMLDVTRREFLGMEERVTKYPQLEITNLNFNPGDLLVKQQKPEQMNLGELKIGDQRSTECRQ